MQDLLEQASKFWAQALQIWSGGGWAMWALLAIALVIFGVGVSTGLKLIEKKYRSVPERVWREWILSPEDRYGRIGQLLDLVGAGDPDIDSEARFTQLRLSEQRPFERDLRVMKICVSAAPLVGLLGTVTGMLATFKALAEGSGGDETMALVASGISEALITTETGLVIALPGLFFQYLLGRGFDRYKAFLAHLETQCTQASFWAQEPEAPIPVQMAARERIFDVLRERLGIPNPHAALRPAAETVREPR